MNLQKATGQLAARALTSWIYWAIVSEGYSLIAGQTMACVSWIHPSELLSLPFLMYVITRLSSSDPIRFRRFKPD